MIGRKWKVLDDVKKF